MRAFLWFGWALFCACFVWQQLHFWPLLPDNVPVHFGLDGTPDRWEPKRRAVIGLLGFSLGVPAVVTAIAWPIPLMPNSLINIPNREFWLSPEHRPQTMSLIRSMLLWIGLSLAWFTLAVIQLTYVASVNQERLNQPVLLLCLGMLLAFMFGIIIWYFKKFAKVPNADETWYRAAR